MDQLYDKLIGYGIEENIASVLSVLIAVVFILVLSILAYLIVDKIVFRLVKKNIERNKVKWDNFLISRKVFKYISLMVPFLIIYLSAPLFESGSELIQRLSLTIILVFALLVISSLLGVVEDVYRTSPVSNKRPIKGAMQVIRIILFLMFGFVIIAILTGENPLVLIGGLGALAAVFSLIFKDAILGFVAGIQLANNDMLRIGDWIDLPKYNVNGIVVDITLTTVKVQSFDKSFATLPSYTLVSDSFTNNRGMLEFGGRRFMRSINIDTSSIKFCTDEMLERFKKIDLLKDYITEKEKEIEQHNAKHAINEELMINGRHMTNIGTFRAYMQNYINSLPTLRDDAAKVVRQLPAGEFGLPLQVMAFTATTDFADYEAIQADIFDHLLAVIGEFELRVYQRPSGHDVKYGYRGDATE